MSLCKIPPDLLALLGDRWVITLFGCTAWVCRKLQPFSWNTYEDTASYSEPGNCIHLYMTTVSLLQKNKVITSLWEKGAAIWLHSIRRSWLNCFVQNEQQLYAKQPACSTAQVNLGKGHFGSLQTACHIQSAIAPAVFESVVYVISRGGEAESYPTYSCGDDVPCRRGLTRSS